MFLVTVRHFNSPPQICPCCQSLTHRDAVCLQIPNSCSIVGLPHTYYTIPVASSNGQIKS